MQGMNRSFRGAFAAGAVVSIAACIFAGGRVDNSSAAIAQLSKGNQRFTTGKNEFPRIDAARRQEAAKGQTPFATVLTCSDSRVPPEFIFDQGIGDLFVVRVAGNVADTDEIATIEYGVGHLHTSVLIVLGHTKCGAVKAVVDGAKVNQNLKWLVDNIVPAYEHAKSTHEHATKDELVQATVEANVSQSIQDILKRSSEVREALAAGHLTIHGGVYDLETGKVSWIGPGADH